MIADFFGLENTTTAVLMVGGPAGIGKTTVWRHAVAMATAAGHRVLESSATASETQLSYTTLRDLLSSDFDEVADVLPPPQRRALGVVLLRAEWEGHTPDPGTIAVAVSSALQALAARQPTVIAIDDIQCVDAASASPLAYALRRSGDSSWRVVLARRASTVDGFGLDRLPHPACRVELEGLSVGALGRVLHDRLDATFPRSALRRIHEASGGNPLHALELARALDATVGHRSFGDALPVPGSLGDLVRERLATLPVETVDLLVVASAASQPSVDLVLAVGGHADGAALEPAIDAGVVAVERSMVGFRHPLYASAVYDLATGRRRREVHAAYAARVDDHEERARHLALAAGEPSDAVAAAVERGATIASRRGSPEAAAMLLSHACRLTPPQSASDRRRRTLAHVDQLFVAGFTDQAGQLIDAELTADRSNVERAGLLSRRARIAHFEADIAASVRLLQQALGAASGDVRLRAEIEEGLAWGMLLLRHDLAAAARHAASAVRGATAEGDPVLLAEARAAEAVLSFVLGRDWQRAMDAAVDLEPHLAGLRVLRFPSFALGYCTGCADRDDETREIFERLSQQAEEHGDEASLPSLLNHLTLVEILAGRWTRAEEIGNECLDRARETGQGPTQASVLSRLAVLAVRRGDVAGARELVSRAFDIAGIDAYDPREPERAMSRGAELAVWALGSAALATGDAGTAADHLAPLCAALLGAGVDDPGEVRALPDAVEALLQSDRRAEATALVERLGRWADRTGRPSVVGAARQAMALHAQVLGDHDRAAAELAVAAHQFELAGRPYEHTRALLLLGVAQRHQRHRRAARQTLQEALAGGEALGAAGLAATARDELAHISGRAPSAGALTPTEERVAGLVAAGHTNREVAAILVVSVHTVEAALTIIYRKLGVRSRSELTLRRYAAQSPKH